MTKRGKLLLAGFLYDYDWDGKYIAGIPVRMCNEGDMSLIWNDNVKITHDGEEYVMIPNSEDNYRIYVYGWVEADDPEDGYVLKKIDWTPTDEEVVAALKKRGYRGPYTGKDDPEVLELFKMRWGEDFN